jgi:predicted acyl esterase
MRARFRESFETPKPLVPNEPAQLRFALQDVSHTFRAGHRMMVQVQSSWFPLCERNPQTFVDIAKAKESDFRAATHKVLHAPDKASAITVTVARGRLP